MVAIEVQFHQYLLDERLVWYAIPQLHHLAVRLFTVQQLVKQVRLLLLGHINDRRIGHRWNRLDLLLRCIQATPLA